jgi:hypothetical protein
MVVAHVIADQAAKMPLVQRDDMVKDLSATTADPPLRSAVLPWCLNARPFGVQARRLQERDHPGVELRIAIEDDVPVRGSLWKRFAQLLDNPLRGRVSSDVAVQDLASSVFDHEEAVQQLECDGGHCEEVERDDHLAMVPEKGEPTLGWITAATNSPEITGHASFGYDEAELLKFSMDLGGTPVWVLFCQAPDQIADFIGDLRPPAARAGPPAQVQPKSRAMPADDGLWLDDGEDIGPARPSAAQRGPEEPVEKVQHRPRSLAFEHCDLLSEGEHFEGGVAASAEEHADCSQDRKDESSTNSPFYHGLTYSIGAGRAGRSPSRVVDFKR